MIRQFSTLPIQALILFRFIEYLPIPVLLKASTAGGSDGGRRHHHPGPSLARPDTSGLSRAPHCATRSAVLPCAWQVLKGTMPPSPEAMHSAECGAALFNPCGLAVSASGVVYIADTGHHRICVLKNDVLHVLAGSGARGYCDGVGQEAAFAHPCGLAIDSEGAVYVADCGNHRIRKVTDDGCVTTVAGSGTAAHRDGQGRSASFYNPCGIAIDDNDVLYVADYSNNCVRVVSKGGVVATLRSHEEDAALDAPYGIAGIALHTSHATCALCVCPA